MLLARRLLLVGSMLISRAVGQEGCVKSAGGCRSTTVYIIGEAGARLEEAG